MAEDRMITINIQNSSSIAFRIRNWGLDHGKWGEPEPNWDDVVRSRETKVYQNLLESPNQALGGKINWDNTVASGKIEIKWTWQSRGSVEGSGTGINLTGISVLSEIENMGTLTPTLKVMIMDENDLLELHNSKMK